MSAACGPAPWFVPIAATPSAPRRAAAVAAVDAADGLAVLVEGQHRDDRQRRDATHRLDRGDELVDVEERLDHEEVDAAILEQPRLLGVERPVRGRVEALQLAERADGAGDEDLPARTPPAPRGRAARPASIALELVLEDVLGELRRLAPKVFVSISSAPARM